MKNFILLISFLFAFHTSYGQIQSGKVVYKIDPATLEQTLDTTSSQYKALKENDAAMRYIIDLIENHIKILPFIELELLFTPHESVFNTSSFMTNDNQLNLKNALGATNTSGIYHNNIKENIYVRQRFELPQTYLVIADFNALEWEIHDETKEILGYTCIKATTNIVESARDFSTTVWFAPELPFPFGPKEFRGLPGIILAMDYNNHYFYAASIDLDSKLKNIKRPTKGKNISTKDYNIKSSKFFGNMRPTRQ